MTELTHFEGKLLDVLNAIHKELVISNMPEHLKDDQRYMFSTINAIQSFSNVIEKMEERNGNQTRLADYKLMRDRREAEYERLMEKGCVDPGDYE